MAYRPGDRASGRRDDGEQGPGDLARRPRNGVGVAALVVGVVALVLAVLILFAPLAALLGLVAVILGVVGVSRAGKGVPTTTARRWPAWSPGRSGWSSASPWP